MGCDDSTPGIRLGNPPDISDFNLAPIYLRVVPDHALGAVKIADSTGQVTILLAPAYAVDLCARMIGACTRLKQGVMP